MNNTVTKLFLVILGVGLLLAAPAAMAQVTLFSEPFTSSLGQFTANNGSNGNWQWSATCNYSNYQGLTGHTAPGAAMFIGSGCMFGNGYSTVSGYLESNTFYTFPGVFPTMLSVKTYMYNECGNYQYSYCYYDRLEIHVSTNGGSTWYAIGSSYYGNIYLGGWNQFTYTLSSSFPSGPMKIRFYFNSLDGIANNYDGIYVDDVTVTGNAPPGTLTVTPPSLTFNVEQGAAVPAPQNLTLTTAPTAFAWGTTLSQSPAPPWFAISPTSGTGGATIVTSILRTDHAPGTYNGNIMFSSTSALPVNVPVILNVVPRVAIAPSADPTIVKFGCKLPGSISSSVQINNSGGHANGGLLKWSATSMDSHVTLINNTGFEGDLLNFSVDATGLPDGSNDFTIVITGYNSVTGAPASNSPYNLTVRVEIEPMETTTQTKAVNTTWTAFTNTYGHKYTELQTTSGTSTITATVHRCEYPAGQARLRFVKRWFTFSGNPPVNMRLYYSNTEAKIAGITNLALIRIWQQPAPGGAWVSRGGVPNTSLNYVETPNMTSFAGQYALAAPWTPKALAFRMSSAAFDRTTRNTVLSWTTDVTPGSEGFLVERASGTNADNATWETVGMVAPNATGEYGFVNAISEEGGYLYRISTTDAEGNGYESSPMLVNAYFEPTTFALEQNYPNPFNPATSIYFSLAENRSVRLVVFDNLGRVVAELVNGEMSRGRHRVEFDASALPSGQYFYRITAGDFTDTKAMLLSK